VLTVDEKIVVKQWWTHNFLFLMFTTLMAWTVEIFHHHWC